MLEKLTPEQERIMYETRDEWINLFFDNVKFQRGIDRPQFEKGIKWLYEDLLHKKNPKIVYCDSWLSCLFTIAIFKNKKIMANVGANVGDNVSENVRANVRANVWDNVWDNVSENVGANVRANVWANLWANVRNIVGDNVSENVRANVRANVWDNVRDEFNKYSEYIDLSNYGWVSFYDFFEKINILDNFKFKQYKNLIKSGVFNAYEYENYVFAVQPPIYIERNGSGRLHSTTTAAVKFRDGICYYFINGRSIPSWVVEERGTITKEKFLSETNSDIKGAIYEVLGQKGMMDMLGAESIDLKHIRHKNGDIETVELLRTKETFKEIDSQPFVWVKMICPSTGTQYLQGVEPHHTDATEAIASLSPFKKEDYSFDYRS